MIIASEKPEAELTGFAAELKEVAGHNNASVVTEFSAPLLPRGGYMAQSKLPERTVHLSIATAWPSTPAEVIDANDIHCALRCCWRNIYRVQFRSRSTWR